MKASERRAEIAICACEEDAGASCDGAPSSRRPCNGHFPRRLKLERRRWR